MDPKTKEAANRFNLTEPWTKEEVKRAYANRVASCHAEARCSFAAHRNRNNILAQAQEDRDLLLKGCGKSRKQAPRKKARTPVSQTSSFKRRPSAPARHPAWITLNILGKVVFFLITLPFNQELWRGIAWTIRNWRLVVALILSLAGMYLHQLLFSALAGGPTPRKTLVIEDLKKVPPREISLPEPQSSTEETPPDTLTQSEPQARSPELTSATHRVPPSEAFPQPEAQATLWIRSNPWSVCFINGTKVGNVPSSEAFTVPTGENTFRLQGQNGRSLTWTANLEALEYLVIADLQSRRLSVKQKEDGSWVDLPASR